MSARPWRPTCSAIDRAVPRAACLSGRAHRIAASDIPSTVSTLVRVALTRAGVNAPMHGAHLLRHSLATDLLRRGASMADIGDVLRHQHPQTTEIYAKVDLTRLRVPRPAVAIGRWPMTPLRRAVDDYLALRRQLGVTLHEAGRVLTAFASVCRAGTR